MSAKAQLVSQTYHDVRAEQVFGKKNKVLSYIQQGAFVTYVEINEKSSSTIVVMML